MYEKFFSIDKTHELKDIKDVQCINESDMQSNSNKKLALTFFANSMNETPEQYMLKFFNHGNGKN